jgi:glycosyltransferase involved in cell wall biosynthesis
MIRVGLDVRECVGDRRTGIARYVVNLIERWRHAGGPVSPVFYGNQCTALPGAIGSVPVRRITERSTLWWDQVSLTRALAADRVDVFLSPYYKAPFAAPCPVVTTIHDLLFLDDAVYPQRGRQRLLRAVFLLMARAMVRRATRIITDSEHSRRDIVRLLGAPDEKLRVIPIGLAPGLRRVGSPERLTAVRATYGLPERYLLYVGNFKPHKNLPRLLRAWASLDAPLRAPYHLVLAGTRDADAAALETLVRTVGLTGRVWFPGLIADADLAAVYSSATALLLPSRHEGFGVPVIEAMACETAVLCSDTTALREVAGDAAVLVDPGCDEAIAAGLARLMTDPDLRRRLVATGVARVARYSADRSGAAVEAVLAEAMGESR